MKTATSLVVPIVVSTVLNEWFFVCVTHGGLIESGQDVVDVARCVVVRNARRGGSPTRLELAVEVVADVDYCLVVSNMPKALAE